MPDKLKKYRDKRDFAKTAEPRGGGKKNGSNIFVIQKHAASSLHYDFRLEIGSVLVSWAVPKGPSIDPAQRRLAIRTEDHPLDYADFEGLIPEDEYGGGTVMVWDKGTYRNLKDEDPAKSLKAGRLEVWLEGEKMSGGFALIRTGQDKQEKWLLIKMRDEKAGSFSLSSKDMSKSALSGLDMEGIRKKYGK